ncbi:hypothetical protein BIW11_10725 [Tropilaelaps mercedesae]|uniref:Uncharacterized protein n=1 Tax=Tropilaelaps mercedesae TaxID=418985 RepID=A0A1V9XEN2_9ACAR|nr:hypothetical protein BIW11_10725 [Tropilaelaps mercedesae]
MATDDSNENSPGRSPGPGAGRSFVLIEPSEYNLILLVLRRLFLCLLMLFLMGLGALAMWMDTDRRYSGFFLALIAFSGTLAVVRKGTHLHDGEGMFADDEDAVMHTSSHYPASYPYPPYLTSPQETPKHSNTAYRQQQNHQRGPPPQFSEEDPDSSETHHSHSYGHSHVSHHHAGVHNGARAHHGPDCPGGAGVAGWLPPPPPPPYHMACPEPPPAYFDIVPNFMDQQNGASPSNPGQHQHHHHHHVDMDVLFHGNQPALGATALPLSQTADQTHIQAPTTVRHANRDGHVQGDEVQQSGSAVSDALLIEADPGPSTSSMPPTRIC